MGLLGLLKKKPRKNYATLAEIKAPAETIEVSDTPLKRSEIGEIDTDPTGLEAPTAVAEAPTEVKHSGFGLFGRHDEDDGMPENPDDPDAVIKLDEAMRQAQKYLIVHAQIPNDLLPKKSSKRENGTFYFEFQDRELHRIELDGSGEVVDWEREKL